MTAGRTHEPECDSLEDRQHQVQEKLLQNIRSRGSSPVVGVGNVLVITSLLICIWVYRFLYMDGQKATRKASVFPRVCACMRVSLHVEAARVRAVLRGRRRCTSITYLYVCIPPAYMHVGGDGVSL